MNTETDWDMVDRYQDVAVFFLQKRPLRVIGPYGLGEQNPPAVAVRKPHQCDMNCISAY